MQTRQHNTEEPTWEKMRQATGGYRVLSHLDDGLHLHMQLLDGVREISAARCATILLYANIKHNLSLQTASRRGAV
jgi:hypothetical protein